MATSVRARPQRGQAEDGLVEPPGPERPAHHADHEHGPAGSPRVRRAAARAAASGWAAATIDGTHRRAGDHRRGRAVPSKATAAARANRPTSRLAAPGTASTFTSTTGHPEDRGGQRRRHAGVAAHGHHHRRAGAGRTTTRRHHARAPPGRPPPPGWRAPSGRRRRRAMPRPGSSVTGRPWPGQQLGVEAPARAHELDRARSRGPRPGPGPRPGRGTRCPPVPPPATSAKRRVAHRGRGGAACP